MSLRRSPHLTPASLAARRTNALKSTGPHTARGKARVGFNALKLGLCAARSARLRERLIRAGYERQEDLYGRIRTRIAQTFGTPTPESRRDADQLATKVWCLATRPQARLALSRTKLENDSEQSAWRLRVSSGHGMGGAGESDNSVEGGTQAAEAPAGRMKFGIREPWRRLGLRFWVQRKRYWTLPRMRRVLLGLEKAAPPGWNEGLEDALRSKVFRLARPGAIEQFRYSLDANGDPDWDREPWKGVLARQLAAQPSVPKPGPAVDVLAKIREEKRAVSGYGSFLFGDLHDGVFRAPQ